MKCYKYAKKEPRTIQLTFMDRILRFNLGKEPAIFVSNFSCPQNLELGDFLKSHYHYVTELAFEPS